MTPTQETRAIIAALQQVARDRAKGDRSAMAWVMQHRTSGAHIVIRYETLAPRDPRYRIIGCAFSDKTRNETLTFYDGWREA